MENKKLLLQSLTFATLAFLFTLARYAMIGGNLTHRWRYATFVSIVALAASFVALRIRNNDFTWKITGAVYLLMFALTSVAVELGRHL